MSFPGLHILKLLDDVNERRLRRVRGFWLRRREDWPYKLTVVVLVLMLGFVISMTIHFMNKAVKNYSKIEVSR